jgi:hypothetical protein
MLVKYMKMLVDVFQLNDQTHQVSWVIKLLVEIG